MSNSNGKCNIVFTGEDSVSNRMSCFASAHSDGTVRLFPVKTTHQFRVIFKAGLPTTPCTLFWSSALHF